MNEKHYPILELCKELTDAGFPVTEKAMVGYKISPIIGMSVDDLGKAVACPSVMEMLDVMPQIIKLFKDEDDVYLLTIFPRHFLKNIYEVGYLHNLSGKYERDTLPNALAEMILWLVKNKHLSFCESKNIE